MGESGEVKEVQETSRGSMKLPNGMVGSFNTIIFYLSFKFV
jgi:hypothetical protein